MASKSTQEPTVVGYWSRSPDDLTLPYPEARSSPWAGQAKFIARLKAMEEDIRARRCGKLTAYRGWSMCRLCQVPNGNEEFEHGAFRWPAGLLHYVEAHNVRPPDAFVNAILAGTP